MSSSRRLLIGGIAGAVTPLLVAPTAWPGERAERAQPPARAIEQGQPTKPGIPARGRGRCLWPRRNCYPPARLWYRVSARLRGELGWEGETAHPLADYFVPGIRSDSILQRWEVESNTAVRLTLRCVDVVDPGAEPFLATRRINGRRRKVGGCPRNARGSLHPTASFAANAAGELFFHSWSTDMASGTGNSHSCEGWSSSDILTSSHGLVGSIATGSSLTDGLELRVASTGPLAGRRIRHDDVRCRDLRSGNIVIARDEQDIEREPGQGGYAPILGIEYLYRADLGGWRPAPEFARIPVRAGNFGRSYSIQREARQPQLEIRSYPLPPTAPYFEFWEKDYDFTLRLEPCPSGGLDVERW